MRTSRARGTARERLIGAAYELFQVKGIRAVGIDAIIDRAGVARMTFYRCFRSKHELVLAFLADREKRWTIDWLESGLMRRALDARGRLLAIFDLFHEWFQRPDYEGCSFIKVLYEDGADGAFGKAAARHRGNVRRLVERLAAEARIPDFEQFAHAWHILMEGAIVAASAGNRQAALIAKQAGETLLFNAVPSIDVARRGADRTSVRTGK
jgi:AcrR family transcriptional regulator